MTYADHPIIELRNVCRSFAGRGGSRFGSGVDTQEVRAVDDVSLMLRRGTVTGLVGASGSGKSTLASLIVGLDHPSEGNLLFEGRSLRQAGRAELKRFRRNVQMVFQDPFGSFDPHFTIGETVEEPLIVQRMGDRPARRAAAIAALEEAGLSPGSYYFDRYPAELSGGQRQRAAIARATVLRPEVLVADEPVSMLDVSVRVGVLCLLKKLVEVHSMALLFITHDLSIVGHLCDELLIMQRGRIVERGAALSILTSPQHEYSKALIAASPIIRVDGEISARSGSS